MTQVIEAEERLERMMALLAALLLGTLSPAQTCINTRLKQRVGTPYLAALLSFVVGTTALVIVTVLMEQSIWLADMKSGQAPWWIWTGGLLGVAFMMGNIILLPKIGTVQTAAFPIAGQIIMGLIVDHYGLFGAERIPMTSIRAVGAGMVLGGALILTIGKNTKRIASPGKCLTSQDLQQTSQISHDAQGTLHSEWFWRILAVMIGMAAATQTAINSHLGSLLRSPVKAACISFVVGLLFLLILNMLMGIHIPARSGEHYPWWIWTGGLFGAVIVIGNVILSKILGIGATVVCVLAGIALGGALIDSFGWFNTPRKPVTAMIVSGLILMIVGAAVIKL